MASQKRQVLYSTKMMIFSAVVVDDVIKVILTKKGVFRKSVRAVSLHWGAKIRVTVTITKTRLEYTRL